MCSSDLFKVMEGTEDVTENWTVPASIAVGNNESIAANAVKYASPDNTNAPTAKVTAGTKAEVTFGMTYVGASKTWENDAKTVDVTGESAVVITVDTSKMERSNVITLDDDLTTTTFKLSDFGITSADKNSTVKFEFGASQKTQAVKEGDNLDAGALKVTVSAVTSGYEYTVTVKNLGGIKAVASSGTTGPTFSGIFKPTAPVTVTKDDIEITMTKAPVIVLNDSCSWNGATATVVVNQAMDKATVEDIANWTFTANSAAGVTLTGAELGADGVTVTLAFANGAPSAATTASTLATAATIKAADGTTSATVQTLTFVDGGTFSVNP